MESFWATLKTECFGDQIPRNRAHAQSMLFEYIETFYNPKRLHSSLGYRSPAEFEQAYWKEQTQAAQSEERKPIFSFRKNNRNQLSERAVKVKGANEINSRGPRAAWEECCLCRLVT